MSFNFSTIDNLFIINKKEKATEVAILLFIDLKNAVIKIPMTIVYKYLWIFIYKNRFYAIICQAMLQT